MEPLHPGCTYACCEAPTSNPAPEILIRNLQIALIRARVPHLDFDPDVSVLAMYGQQTRPEAEAIHAMVQAAVAQQAAPRETEPRVDPARIAWWTATRDIGDRPWNWRVFLGPVVYVNWNDRRQATR